MATVPIAIHLEENSGYVIFKESNQDLEDALNESNEYELEDLYEKEVNILSENSLEEDNSLYYNKWSGSEDDDLEEIIDLYSEEKVEMDHNPLVYLATIGNSSGSEEK